MDSHPLIDNIHKRTTLVKGQTLAPYNKSKASTTPTKTSKADRSRHDDTHGIDLPRPPHPATESEDRPRTVIGPLAHNVSYVITNLGPHRGSAEPPRRQYMYICVLRFSRFWCVVCFVACVSRACLLLYACWCCVCQIEVLYAGVRCCANCCLFSKEKKRKKKKNFGLAAGLRVVWLPPHFNSL